jgi:ParB family chromosome partitioning protein
MSKRRLGRGLDGLLPPVPGTSTNDGRVAKIEEVNPNRTQPRRFFDESALEELTQSIQEHGILEPILVRRLSEGGYEIVCGERRWRAAQRAGLHEVPVFVREFNDQSAFEAALVENIQRADLSPLETARAYQRLVQEYSLTQEQVAKRVGKSRSAVANSMRLLQLPDEVLELIEAGRLSEGHGRAILGAASEPEMLRIARLAVSKKLTVRDVEKHARATTPNGGEKPKGPPSKSANILDLETRLSRSLGARVRVDDQKGKGKIVVDYASLDELDRLLKKLL